jgi:hypothetical protein
MTTLKNSGKILNVLIVFLFFFALTLSSFGKEIHSTKTGGNWNDKNTWVGKQIPAKEDSVFIDSNILVTDNAFCGQMTVNIDCLLSINENTTLNCNMIFLKKEGNREGLINNLGTIVVEEADAQKKDESK